MDDLTDASDHEPEPVPFPAEPVEEPFPNMQNLQPMMPEEVPYHELIDYLHEPENEPDQFHQENVQVGFVQLFQPEAEIAFTSWVDSAPVFKPHPEAIRQ
jgi:hypothetical protein